MGRNTKSIIWSIAIIIVLAVVGTYVDIGVRLKNIIFKWLIPIIVFIYISLSLNVNNIYDE